MKEIRVLALCLSVAFPAAALSPRTFVSVSGLDTDPCSRTQPCRSFGAALVQTAAGGTIVVLDSAGYGTITIAQSVSVVAPEGVYAGISATSGNAITISGAAPTDIVRLRGLSIEGSGTGTYGIRLGNQPLKELHVERCNINGFVTAGIDLSPSTAGASLFVTDTTVANAGTGIRCGASLGLNPRVSADRCQILGNGSFGFWTDQALGTITNSLVSGNGTGVLAQFAATFLTVDHCQISGNGTGIFANLSSTIYVSNSTVSNNGTGLSATGGGVLFSRIGDSVYAVKTNTIVNNTTPGSFTGTFLAE